MADTPINVDTVVDGKVTYTNIRSFSFLKHGNLSGRFWIGANLDADTDRLLQGLNFSMDYAICSSTSMSGYPIELIECQNEECQHNR